MVFIYGFYVRAGWLYGGYRMLLAAVILKQNAESCCCPNKNDKGHDTPLAVAVGCPHKRHKGIRQDAVKARLLLFATACYARCLLAADILKRCLATVIKRRAKAAVCCLLSVLAADIIKTASCLAAVL